VPPEKATAIFPQGLLTPFVCSLVAHLGIASLLVLLGSRAVVRARTDSQAIPVSIRGAPLDMTAAPPRAAGADLGPATLRRRTRLAARAVPPPPLPAPAVDEEAVNGADSTAPVERGPAATEAPLPTESPQDGDGATATSIGTPRGGPTATVGSAAGTPPSGGWGPGGGPWMGIRQAIERHVIYPTIGRRLGWAGKVVLTFVIRADGSVQDVRVRESSGHRALDESATQAVHRAAPLPHANESVQIVMPIEFALRQ
jgi:periplasmic protein TonB